MTDDAAKLIANLQVGGTQVAAGCGSNSFGQKSSGANHPQLFGQSFIHYCEPEIRASDCWINDDRSMQSCIGGPPVE
jgi:hypothetical protein